MLSGKSFAQAVEENLKALRIGCRQDQERAGSIHRANRSVEVNEFSNELRGDRWSHAWGSPTRPGKVHPTEASFVGEHDPQPTTMFCGRLAFLTASAKLFVIVVLRLGVSVGMKEARHQLAPIVAVENVIDELSLFGC